MKKAAQTLTLGFVGVLAAFLLPSFSYAASPYTDEFENYNAEGWLTPAGGGSCGFSLPSATTSGYTGSGIQADHQDCFGNNKSIGLYHSGGYTSAGGYRIWIKPHVSSAKIVDFTFCFLTLPCSATGNLAEAGGLNLNSLTQDMWHYVDLTFIPQGTSTTLFSLYVDGALSTSNSYSTTTIMTATGVRLNLSGYSSGEWLVLDSLQNEFSLIQQSQADIINQSFYVSTTTAQETCNGTYATTTGLFSDIANGVSYGLCTVGVFLFVPNTTITGQFAGLPNQLSTKFPFSWYFDVKNEIGDLQASSTANYPDVEYSGLPITSIVGSGGITIASSTTIQALAPDSTWIFVRTLMGYMLWIGFAYFVYHKTRTIWQTV